MAVGFKIADGYVEVHAVVDENAVRDSAHRAGMVFGDDFDRDVVRRSRRTGEDGGDEAGRGWFRGFMRTLFQPNHTLSRILPGWFEVAASPVTAAGFALGLAWAIAFLAAVVSSGVMVALGGLFLALGAFALRANKQVKTAWLKTIGEIDAALTRAAKPLIAPFVLAAKIIQKSIPLWEPILKRIFAIIGPAVGPLTEALVMFTVNFLGGIEKAAPAIRDIMLAFAQELPDLGTALGDFFVYLAENKDWIIEALRIIFTNIQILLMVLAYLLIYNTKVFVQVAHAWNAIVDAISAATSWVVTNVPKAWQSVADFFKGLWDGVAGWFVGVWNSITSTSVSAGSAFIGFWVGLWNAVSGFFVGLWNNIVLFFQGIWNTIVMTVQNAVAVIGGIINTFVVAAFTIWEEFWKLFGDLVKTSFDLVVAYFSIWSAALGEAWSAFTNFLSQTWSTFTNRVILIWQAFLAYAQSLARSGLNLIVRIFYEAMNQMDRGIRGFVAFFQGLWNFLWSWTVSFTVGTWNRILFVIQSIWSQIFGVSSGNAGRIMSAIRGAWSYILSLTVQVWNGLVSTIRRTLSDAWNNIRNTFNTIVRFIASLYHSFFEAGVRIIQGIIDGITSKLDALAGKMKSVADRVRGFLPFSPAKEGPLSGRGSPEIAGRKITEMLGEGIMSGVGNVQAAIDLAVRPAGPTPVAATAAAGASTATANGGGGDTYVINLKGVWDFANKGEEKKVVARLHDAIEEHKRGYSR